MFKPGDKVICVDSKGTSLLKMSAVYTVRSIDLDAEVLLVEISNNHYPSNRFISTEDKPNTVDEGIVTASKNDKEKVDLSLIPAVSMLEHAKAFMVGEKKYGRYNYCKGHKASQLVAAAMRHLTAWNEGEEHDPKDGQHHLGSVMACCSMILKQMELGTMTDDRFKK